VGLLPAADGFPIIVEVCDDQLAVECARVFFSVAVPRRALIIARRLLIASTAPVIAVFGKFNAVTAAMAL